MGKGNNSRNPSPRRCCGAILCCLRRNSARNWMPVTHVSGGLTRDELRYILDPKDVYGDDFPSETFRVLKEKEIKQYGEYRTRRLVLEKWDEQQAKS